MSEISVLDFGQPGLQSFLPHGDARVGVNGFDDSVILLSFMVGVLSHPLSDNVDVKFFHVSLELFLFYFGE